MPPFRETDISRAILDTYHKQLRDRIASDVIIVGAGPAGLVAGTCLAQAGAKVTILERRLAPGGGIWGGGMAMNVAVVQAEAVTLLDDLRIPSAPCGEGLCAVDTIDLAAGLCVRARAAGVAILNLATVEDLCVHGGRVTGAVVNRSEIAGRLPVDPIAFAARAVVDATGHEAVLVQTLRKRSLLQVPATACEGPMDAAAGERFVVDRAGQIYPGLWITGMSVAATLNGPRMGPIFGGMLLSGRRVAELIQEEIDQDELPVRAPGTAPTP